MPVSCEIDFNVVVLRLDDRHTHAEERSTLARALVDPRLVVPARLLVDVRRSRENPNGESIAERARCLGRLGEGALNRCAVVVSTPLHYGLARMFAAYAIHRGVSVAIFGDEAGARAWLRDEGAASTLAELRTQPAIEGFPGNEGVRRADGPGSISGEREQAAPRSRPDATPPAAPAVGKPSAG
jgi:hypothetical protein